MTIKSQLFVVSLALGCLFMVGCNDDSGVIGTGDQQHNGNGDPQNNDQNGNKTCECAGGCDENFECLDPCDKCTSEQICNSNKQCEPKPAVDACNNSCKSDETCTSKGCVKTSEICDPVCVGDRVCKENTCVFECSVHCGDKCCADNEVCDPILNTCGGVCLDGTPQCNGSCCDSNQECLDVYGCTDVCDSATQHQCIVPGVYAYCCNNDELCDTVMNRCTKDCGSNIKCNEICCGDSEICYEDEVSGEKSCKQNCSATQTRCGADKNLCCNKDTENCLFNECVPIGLACEDLNDCEMDEFCEETTHTCVKSSVVPTVCEYKPPKGEFSPKEQWHWKEQNIVGTPVVINLTDDNGDLKVNKKDIPEVVFVATNHKLYALSGDTGETLAQSTDAIYNLYNDIAAADIDEDGEIEVLVPSSVPNAQTAKAGLYGMVLRKNEESGKYEWHQKYYIKTYYRTGNQSYSTSDLHPQIANVDSQGKPEILITAGIVQINNNNEFEIKCSLTPKAVVSTPWYDYMPILADLDQDGNHEIIFDNQIFTHTPVSDTDKSCKLLAAAENDTGWTYLAVADLLPNEETPSYPGELIPEIVRVKGGKVSVWKVYKSKDTDGKDVWNQKKIRETTVPGNRGNGNPTIADFDGDGQKDIGLAGYSHYSVINGQTGDIVWASKTQDASSERTGSTVFDFEGDGISEVVYRDEVLLRIYSGPGAGEDIDKDGYPDGVVLWSTQNTSGTVIEYPIVVDVDNDGKTEIVMVSEPKDGITATTGVTVFTDTYNNWVRTRRIWNQHTYHVTNINEDGIVPLREEANWLTYNNYRQNVQPEGVFNAPDFQAGDLVADTTDCDKILLTANVSNEGSYGVRAGLRVSFYVAEPNGMTGQNIFIGTSTVEKSLSPGGHATATLEWNRKIVVGDETITVNMPANVYFVIDEATDESPNGDYNECHEENNQSNAVTLRCSAA